MKKVLEADELNKKIESDLEKLVQLDRKEYAIQNGPATTNLQYYLDEKKVGQMSVVKKRGVMFYSDLE